MLRMLRSRGLRLLRGGHRWRRPVTAVGGIQYPSEIHYDEGCDAKPSPMLPPVCLPDVAICLNAPNAHRCGAEEG